MIKKRSLIERTCPECGQTKMVRKDAVGKYCKSCRAKLNSRNKKPIEMIGHISGRLKVIEFSHIYKKQYFWKSICECGNFNVTSGNRLRSYKTKSCGCITRTQNRLSTSSTYRSWRAMLQRCYDNKVPHYSRYGGAGISVCDKWRDSFANFLDEMGVRPENMTLDRINAYGNYEKDNCRWADIRTQTLNRRNNHDRTKEESKENIWRNSHRASGKESE